MASWMPAASVVQVPTSQGLLSAAVSGKLAMPRQGHTLHGWAPLASSSAALSSAQASDCPPSPSHARQYVLRPCEMVRSPGSGGLSRALGRRCDALFRLAGLPRAMSCPCPHQHDGLNRILLSPCVAFYAVLHHQQIYFWALHSPYPHDAWNQMLLHLNFASPHPCLHDRNASPCARLFDHAMSPSRRDLLDVAPEPRCATFSHARQCHVLQRIHSLRPSGSWHGALIRMLCPCLFQLFDCAPIPPNSLWEHLLCAHASRLHLWNHCLPYGTHKHHCPHEACHARACGLVGAVRVLTWSARLLHAGLPACGQDHHHHSTTLDA
mmetsp:Transcript_79201/g.199012  ORF Transcript_79201/g.199012 Transcript_79201/m.199012 type:complete len:323 (+) Transcript_79201:350-1318(+)